MGTKVKIVILAIMIAVGVGLSLLDWRSKTKQTTNDVRQSLQQEDVIEGNVLIRILWTLITSNKVIFEAIINNKPEEVYIDLDNILIKVRTDNQNITTISLPDNEIKLTILGYSCSTGTILVPNQEDSEVWQNWLNKLKQKRKAYLVEQEAKKKARRVLPSTD